MYKKRGIIRSSRLRKRVSYLRLLSQNREGKVYRLKAGVYATPEALAEMVLDIPSIIPGGILCMYSAWDFHHLTVQIPPACCVAVKRGRKVVLPAYPPIKLYWVNENIYTLGMMETKAGNKTILVYDKERSVCDALRARNKIGTESSSEILRNYLASPDKDVAKLCHYARKLRIYTLLKHYLEFY